MAKELTLWHGGRNLEHSYRENVAPKGRWDHGPGLYLTTSYERAVKYGKGGGRTYKVTVEDGNFINDVNIPIDVALDFVNTSIIKSKIKTVLSYIQDNMKRLNVCDKINADTFLNIVLNEEAITKSRAPLLAQFLVEQGVDYSKVKNYGGSNEDVLLVINRDKIKNVKWIPAKNVSLDEYDLNLEFSEVKSSLKIK